ncbi:MAG: ATP-binding protein [Myxococcota bacterium]
MPSVIMDIVNYLRLPKEVTEFERKYLGSMNRVGMYFFLAHPPVLMLVAALAGTGILRAALFGGVAVAGPLLAYSSFKNPRHVSVAYGFAAMTMGGLLVHFGQGPMQIEMHFYFFVLLALLAVFGNPMAIVVAALTVAAHHLLLWFLLPSSVFNYDAPVTAVAVHAAFVVLESIAGCFVARNFFDSVIGLERIVAQRTGELDGRNRDMRVVLDHVNQGLVALSLDQGMNAEHSAALERWLGPITQGQRFSAYLSTASPSVGEWFALGWETIREDTLPLELAIEQLPRRLIHQDRHYRLEYSPILNALGGLDRMLVVVSDISAEVQRNRYEEEQREILSCFERITRDREGFLEFWADSAAFLERITQPNLSDVELRRALHTLKGNSALFGLRGFSAACHELEARVLELGSMDAAMAQKLKQRWQELAVKLDAVLGDRGHGVIEIDDLEYQRILKAIAAGRPRGELMEMILDWKLESAQARLERIGEQAVALAERLSKGPVVVRVEDNGLRLPREKLRPMWATLSHAIRNAVDHGLESPEFRAQEKGGAPGTITLRTRAIRDWLEVEITDDGRGIDWDRVAEAARVRGMPSSTTTDLVEAIFADGVSTARSTTEISGRGVGMGALRSACRALRGDVQIESRPGQGTKVTCRVPQAMLATDAPSTTVSMPPAAKVVHGS